MSSSLHHKTSRMSSSYYKKSKVQIRYSQDRTLEVGQWSHEFPGYWDVISVLAIFITIGDDTSPNCIVIKLFIYTDSFQFLTEPDKVPSISSVSCRQHRLDSGNLSNFIWNSRLLTLDTISVTFQSQSSDNSSLKWNPESGMNWMSRHW